MEKNYICPDMDIEEMTISIWVATKGTLVDGAGPLHLSSASVPTALLIDCRTSALIR